MINIFDQNETFAYFLTLPWLLIKFSLRVKKCFTLIKLLESYVPYEIDISLISLVSIQVVVVKMLLHHNIINGDVTMMPAIKRRKITHSVYK